MTIVAVAASWLLAGVATAQTPAPKIWDVKPGTPVSALPLDQFVDTACGTNGGPPARVLTSFAEFAQCARERTTGLHEVWFRYDDEMEYIARARRSDIMIRQHQANSLAGQPIITSLLIDAAGLVQYRMRQRPARGQPHAPCRFRPRRPFKGIAGLGLACTSSRAGRGRAPDRRLVPQRSAKDGRTGVPGRSAPLPRPANTRSIPMKTASPKTCSRAPPGSRFTNRRRQRARPVSACIDSSIRHCRA